MTSASVHVWRFALDLGPRAVAGLWGLLDGGERSRAFAFADERVRARFVAARGHTRLALAALTGTAPARLSFSDVGAGKPRLAEPDQGLEFNIAHCGPVMVLAAADVAVGVDVERRGRVPAAELLNLAKAAFAPAEIAGLSALAPRLRADAILELWVRREAVLKGLGLGLTAPAGLVDLSGASGALGPSGESGAVRIGDGAQATVWALRDLDLGADHLGAVAAQAKAIRVIRHEPASLRAPFIRGPRDGSYPGRQGSGSTATILSSLA
ncbi:MAG: 4'-phosphopantetheinyl transferase superfamily protein [Alphaproteobacteria bacterium]